jgi:hypothetical protein
MISSPDDRDFGSAQILIANSVSECWSVTAGDASRAGVPFVFRSTTSTREVGSVTTQMKI